MPLQKHLRELWNGICKCRATTRPGSLRDGRNLAGKVCFSTLVSPPLFSIIPSSTSHPNLHLIFIPKSSLRDTRSSGTIDLLSLRQHMFTSTLWFKGWKCQPLRGWDLGSPLLSSGQYVVLICLANEELTFLSGCVLLKWRLPESWQEKQSSQGSFGLSEPFGRFQSKGSQTQMSVSQLWLPHYWAWSNSTKTGQYWSNLPPVH